MNRQIIMEVTQLDVKIGSESCHRNVWALCKRPLFIVTLRKNITRNKYFIYLFEDNVVTMFLIEQSI